jgi:hypothetical protein
MLVAQPAAQAFYGVKVTQFSEQQLSQLNYSFMQAVWGS